MFCGVSGDELLVYETLKVVRIKDYRLGCMYYTFVALIVGWVVGYQILYSNDHFEKLDVEGTAQLTVLQPTVNGCNANNPACRSDFTPLTQLRYCRQYAGAEREALAVDKRDCIFADRHTLDPLGQGAQQLLVPTRLDLIVEQPGCKPSAENGFSCDNEWRIVNRTDVVYVADIERVTVKISHAFGRGDVTGYSPTVPGSYLRCRVAGEDSRRLLPLEAGRGCTAGFAELPIQCLTGSCPFLLLEGRGAANHIVRTALDQEEAGSEAGPAGAAAPTQQEEQPRSRRRAGGLGGIGVLQAGAGREPPAPQPSEEAARREQLRREGVYAIPEGDVFSLGKLLELAGVSLDLSRDKHGKPARETGTVVEVNVVYSNLHPFSSTFGDKRVSYHYNVRQRPVGEMKTELVSTGVTGGTADRPPGARVIEDRHGVLVVVRIGGTFGFLSPMYLLIMLTTALGLLTGASFLTDKLAIHLMRRAEHLDVMIDSTGPLNK